MRGRGKCFALLVMAACIVTGCARGGKSSFDPGEDRVMIERDGTCRSASVAQGTGGKYDEKELKAFVQESLERFNEEHGEGSAELSDASIKDQTIKVFVNYASPQLYLDLAEENQDENVKWTLLETGALEEYSEELSNVTFVTDRQKAADIADILKEKNLRVVATEGDGLIQTEGKVRYITEGCSMRDSYTVQTTEGSINYIIFE